MNFPPQTILKLKVSYYKKIATVEITPESGETVKIGGVNGAGKSSVLEAIQAAFAGAKAFAENPINDAGDKSEIIVETQDLVITRKITPSGNTVVIKNKADAKIRYASPQEFLDGFYGAIGFDPAAFQSMEAADQRRTLQQLLNIDFDAVDAARKEKYDLRTAVNKELASAKSDLTSIPEIKDAPEREQSIAELSDKLKSARDANAIREKMDQSVTKSESELKALEKLLNDTEEYVLRLKMQVLAKKEEIKTFRETSELFEAADEQAILDEMSNVEATNAKVRVNARRKAALERVELKEKESAALSDEIAYIDQKKKEAIEAAKFPVAGLSFNESGVLYNGKPFADVSRGEQIRVSVAMGMALNPNLRVILIRDGSLLDRTSIAVVEAIAAQEGYQVWLELVTDTPEEDAECSVVINEGNVQ